MENNSENKYICNYCGRSFKNKSSYTLHINVKHLKITKINIKYELCSICNKQIKASVIDKHKEKCLHKQIENNKSYTCESCGKLVTKKFGSGRFCSQKCANSHILSKETKQKISNALKGRNLSDETKEKISISLINSEINKRYKYICEKCNNIFFKRDKIKEGRKIHCNNCKRQVRHSNDNFINIKELSKRTINKIIKRLKVKCVICGWNKANCDIHHIVPRKEGGNNDNSNLVFVCPNCHRMIHSHCKEITREMLFEKSIQTMIDDIKKSYHPIN